MGTCPPVRGDNPRALASGLSNVQMDKKQCFRLSFFASRSTNGNQNSVSNDFLSTFVDITNVFDCRPSGVG